MSNKLRAAAKAALDWLESTKTQSMEEYLQVIDSLKAALAEPEQEPVGKFSKFSDGVWKEVTASSPGIFLYTAPPRREWVGLTGDEIWTLHDSDSYPSPVEFAQAIETKLREKNGG